VQVSTVDKLIYIHKTLACGVISDGNTISNLDDAAIGEICVNCTA
jgi:hypothetical protein